MSCRAVSRRQRFSRRRAQQSSPLNTGSWRERHRKDRNRCFAFSNRSGSRLVFDLLGLLLRSGYRRVADPLFNEITGMVGAFLEIQVPTIFLSVFHSLELRRNRILSEAAD